jgi:hypothetical protein
MTWLATSVTKTAVLGKKSWGMGHSRKLMPQARKMEVNGNMEKKTTERKLNKVKLLSHSHLLPSLHQRKKQQKLYLIWATRCMM